MALKPGSFEFNLFLTLTLILLASKLILCFYLLLQIYRRKKETGKITFSFITSAFVLMVCLFISRLIFAYWDFFLTEFDPNKFYTYPNVVYWKCASLTMAIGFSAFFFALDKNILKFKFKGVLAYIMLTVGLIQLFYPIKDLQDFYVMASFAFILNLLAIAIPIIFIYIGKNAPQYRKSAYLIALGTIIYAIGTNIVIESFLAFLERIWGTNTRIIVYFLFLILKITGLSIFTYSISKFVRIFSNK